MRFVSVPSSRYCLVVFGLLSQLNACGSKAGDSGTPAPATSSSAGAANSPVSDTTAQKQVVTAQLNTAVSALSDGGVGASGGGGTGAGLVDSRLLDGSFSETRKCAATALSAATSLIAPDASLSWTLPAATVTSTVTRTFTGTTGNLTYASNADGSASGETEVWEPGPYWGITNITAAAAADNWGNVPASGVPAVAGAIKSAPATSSGTLGSVGFRSLDGSWTGAPVWEVGTGYTVAGVAATATEGMTMYLSTGLPTVTAASTAPTVGGVYAVKAMVVASTQAASSFSVLGVAAAGVLPSFTAAGSVVVGGVAKTVGQAGTVTKLGIPARLYNPPTKLACNPLEPWPLIGWKFSQNVAGLTRIGTHKSTESHTYTKGSSVVVQTGTRMATFSDPAVSAPVASKPTSPYFDENAGTISLTHSLSVGSQGLPNTTVSTYTPTATGTANPVISLATYSPTPFVVTTTHNINNGSWTWMTKTVASGAITAATSVGGATASAMTTTTFKNIVFTNNSNKALACIPTSGTITTAITPTDATMEVTTTTLHFGTSVTAGVTSPSGVTATVTCSGGSTGATNCTASSEVDDPDYKPSGCNF